MVPHRRGLWHGRPWSIPETQQNSLLRWSKGWSASFHIHGSKSRVGRNSPPRSLRQATSRHRAPTLPASNDSSSLSSMQCSFHGPMPTWERRFWEAEALGTSFTLVCVCGVMPSSAGEPGGVSGANSNSWSHSPGLAPLSNPYSLSRCQQPCRCPSPLATATVLQCPLARGPIIGSSPIKDHSQGSE